MFQDFLILILIFEFLTFLFLVFQFLRLNRRVSTFFKGGENLEGLLINLTKKLEGQEKEIEKISKEISKLDKIAKISFQKIGIVRYNPFKDVGGNQSFSIALLDNQHSGFVITSLYLKEGSRFFAKPIIRGKSDYSLSEEEKEAIEKAIKKLD